MKKVLLIISIFVISILGILVILFVHSADEVSNRMIADQSN